jgi:trans-aconitate methyltransferase
LLLQRFPDAAIDLVDISKEMLARVRSAIGEREELRFIESDINIYKPEFKYDYFFSSRVLEYIDDKQKFCARIFSILKKGSRGFLITKMPHYKREKFLRKGKSTLHHGQIAPDELKALLHEAGFVDIHMFPVTMVFPLLHSARLNKLVGILFETKAIGRVGSFFAESYCVTFRKP